MKSVKKMDIEMLKEKRTMIKERIKEMKQTIRKKEGGLRRIEFLMLGLIYKQKSGKKVYSSKKVTVLKFNDHDEGLGYANWQDEGTVVVGKGIELYRRGVGVIDEKMSVDVSNVNNISEFVKAVDLDGDEWIIVILETTGKENMSEEVKAKVFKFGEFNPFVNKKKFLDDPDISFSM